MWYIQAVWSKTELVFGFSTLNIGKGRYLPYGCIDGGMNGCVSAYLLVPGFALVLNILARDIAEDCGKPIERSWKIFGVLGTILRGGLYFKAALPVLLRHKREKGGEGPKPCVTDRVTVRHDT